MSKKILLILSLMVVLLTIMCTCFSAEGNTNSDWDNVLQYAEENSYNYDDIDEQLSESADRYQETKTTEQTKNDNGIDKKDDFVVMMSTDKFHYPDCYHLERAYEYNKDYRVSTIRKLIDDGYSPCEDCIGYVDYNPHSTTNRVHHNSGHDNDYTTTKSYTTTRKTYIATTSSKTFNKKDNNNIKNGQITTIKGIIIFLLCGAISIVVISYFAKKLDGNTVPTKKIAQPDYPTYEFAKTRNLVFSEDNQQLVSEYAKEIGVDEKSSKLLIKAVLITIKTENPLLYKQICEENDTLFNEKAKKKYRIKDNTPLRDYLPLQLMQALCRKEFSILVENIYTTSDTLIFLKYFLLYASKDIEDGKIYNNTVVDYIIETTNNCLCVEFNFEPLELFNNESRREDYCKKLFLRYVDTNTHAIKTDEIISAFVQIILYSKHENNYVDYDDETPVLVVDIDETVNYTIVANTLFSNASKTMVKINRLVEEMAKHSED